MGIVNHKVEMSDHVGTRRLITDEEKRNSWHEAKKSSRACVIGILKEPKKKTRLWRNGKLKGR